MGDPGRRGVVFRLAQGGAALASVRYRGLLPALALQDLGWPVELSTGRAAAACPPRLAIAVKPLSEADAGWVAAQRDAGTPLVIDLCDNVFVDGYGGDARIAPRLAGAMHGCTVTVPTEPLRDVVIDAVGCAPDDVLVVPDILESPALLRRQLAFVGRPTPWARSLARGGMQRFHRGARRVPGRRPELLWFGNHGAAWGRFGLSDLSLFEEALREASRRHGARLWVVSNHRERFEALRPRLPIETRYVEWSPLVVDDLLARVDVCLVPNSLDDFSRTKSVNRAVKALGAGVPVVATATPAFAPLREATWLHDPAEGIAAYLEDASLRRRHLEAARRVIARDYSMAALRAAMSRVVVHAGAIA